MGDLILRLLPVFVLFAAGFLLARGGLLRRSHADGLLQLVVHIGLPALILSSVSTIELDASLSYLPLSAALTILAMWPIARWTGHRLRLPRRSLAVFIIGPMIMNMAFLYPFVLAGWGAQGFALLALFDFGNGVLVLTLVYAMAAWYGGQGGGRRHLMRALSRFTPLWALAAALVINLTDVAIPPGFQDILATLGRWLVLLVMVALGAYLAPRRLANVTVATAIGLRTGVGLLLGLGWVRLFGLEGLMASVVILGAAAPVGFNTLVFAGVERLDKELAAAIASIGLLLGLIYVPLMIVWLTPA